MSRKGELKELGTDLDVITNYIRKEGNMGGLSYAQKKKMVRWNFADNLIQAHPYWNDTEIVIAIRDKFKISKTIAFYDLQNAKLLFGSRHIEHKPFWKQYLIEEAKKGIEKALNRQKPDLKAHYEYLKLIAGVTGVYEDDPDQLTAEMMRPADNYIMINVDNKHLHLHLDKLEEMDPELVQMIHQSVVEDLPMPEIEIDGTTEESS